jgi:hypothetical protein
MDSLWCAYPAIRMMTAVCEMFYGPEPLLLGFNAKLFG